jgi:hypothetical protein
MHKYVSGLVVNQGMPILADESADSANVCKQLDGTLVECITQLR